MLQRAKNSLGGSWLIRTAVLLILLVGSLSRQSVLADPIEPQALDLNMTMTTSTHISLGEPLVVHYTIKNTATVGQITFHSGQKSNEWYTFSLAGPNGRTVTSAPPPTVGATQGLQPAPEASIPHGDRMEGDIIVTRYLAVPGPGNYTLVVHAATPYYVEPDGAGWYPEGRPRDMQLVDLTRDFRFPLTVTPANPAALRATAEALRRRLMDVRYDGQWESFTEQLFSLPEAEALPIWRDLLTDPRTDDLVLRTAAEQLASQPAPAHADLLAEVLWERVPPMNISAHPWVARTLFKMYETASGPLKQHIRSLYAAHGDSSVAQSEEMKAKQPN